MVNQVGQLYSHKKPAFEQFTSYVDSGCKWILVEGAGAGTGTSFFMQHLYQQLPHLGFQSLYIEAAPKIDSTYPVSQQLVNLFDTKAVIDQKSVFHRAIELLRRYNFSPLYVLCDLSFTEEQSSINLLKEAEFLSRHAPKHQLRFVFSKNWTSFLAEDDSENCHPGHQWTFKLRQGGKDGKGGKQIWQVVGIAQPELVDMQIHISQYLAAHKTDYQVDNQFYKWLKSMVGNNFSQINEVMEHIIRQAQSHGLNDSSYLEFSFMQKQAQIFLKDYLIRPSSAA